MLAPKSRVQPARSALRIRSLLVGGLGLLFAACGGPPPIEVCDAADGVTPVCGFQNPEDLAVDASGQWLIVSQSPLEESPGTLVAFRPSDGAKELLWPGPDAADVKESSAGDDTCPGLPDLEGFVPHGIDLSDDGRTLFVVNHGGREAVELFAVGAAGGVPTLEWKGCVVMPEAAMMNDVAALPAVASEGDDFVVTQMTSSGFNGLLTLARGKVSGQVFRWSKANGLRPIPSTEGVGPNGVEVSPDGSAVFFSEWIGRNVVRVELDGSGRRSVPLEFNPDNLTWTSDGRLLVGGQITTPLGAASCFEVSEGTCGLPSAAATIHPETLEVIPIWTHDPATVAGGASVALEHDGKIWIGTFGGDRLAWFAKPAP